MSRISGSLRTNRIRSNYVNRNKAHQISEVDPLSSVEKVKNSNEQPSENFLDSYELYYQKLKNLKKEFRTFYHREKELYQAIGDLETHQQKFIKHTNDLVNKYNQTLQALYSFDRAVSGQHVVDVRKTLQMFQTEMKALGITEDEQGFLAFDPEQFIQFIIEDEAHFEELLKQFRQLIIESYKSLTKIRLKKEMINPYEAKTFDYKGMIIEEET